MDIIKLPKVELHVHLDGSIRPVTMAALANMSIKEVINCSTVNSKCTNLNDYLKCFSLPMKIMQTTENLELIAYELALDLKAENVIYAEVRFAPLKHANNILLDDVILAVIKGFRKVDIKINLILCMMRDATYLDNEKVIYLAHKYKNNGVVGIDLAGDEELYKTEQFKELFSLAKSLNINYTIHAGEADGVDSIISAINFGAKRIGHGVRCIEDSKLVSEIIRKDILLEVCPTSNIQTCIYNDITKHPIKRLYDLGVSICVNTDNRTVSCINLCDEYRKLIKYFNFTIDDLKKMNINAIKGSFLTADEKEYYINILRND